MSAPTMSQRRQLLLDAFDRQERMSVLLSCLPHSPNHWEEEDEEVVDLMNELVAEGLIDDDDTVYRTNANGRAELISYITEGEEE